MKILMLLNDVDVIDLLFHDFDELDLLFHDSDVINLSYNTYADVTVTYHLKYHEQWPFQYYIYHGSYESTYLNQRIRRMSWFK
jgi:hypothetical protein